MNGDRARCLELGIFPEDADVPLDVVAVVWGKDRTDTEILATRMDELALLKLDLSPKPGQAGSSGAIRLHDAMSCYFAEQLSQPWLAQAKLADYSKTRAPRRRVPSRVRCLSRGCGYGRSGPSDPARAPAFGPPH